MKSVYVKDREFHKDVTMERNRSKKYRHIDRERVSNEIFRILDKIVNGTKNDNENLLQESDTESIAEEPIPYNKQESHQLLTQK